MGVGEAKEPFEDDIDFRGQPGKRLGALVGRARIGAVGRRAERQHHHECRDNEHAGDDGDADVHTRAASVEQRIQDANEERLLLFPLIVVLLVQGHNGVLPVGARRGLLGGIVGIGFHHEMLHETRRHDAAAEGAEKAYERLYKVALPYHENDDDESHTEGSAEVGQRNELIFLEVAGEMLVFRKCDDGGIVGKKRQHGAQRGHTGQIEQRAHQRAEQLLQQVDHAKLYEHLADGTRQHADGHQIETRVQQQVVGRMHHGVEHRGCTHFPSQQGEQAHHDEQADNTRAVVRRFHRIYILLDISANSGRKVTTFIRHNIQKSRLFSSEARN